ncbi:hypothetical protein CHISP_0347 [Chitinispirillum alkaliphilum]|nr:hypothetical protein CHISP_0347 [Chitinispirillum alkaliphilum]
MIKSLSLGRAVKILVFKLLICFFTGEAYSAQHLCEISDQEWNRLRNTHQQRLLRNFDPNQSDNECFCIYTDRLLNSRNRRASQIFLSALDSKAGKDFPIPFLLCLYGVEVLRNDSTLWTSVVSLWEKNSEPPFDIVSGYLNRRRFRQADTLFSILDKAGRLNADDLMRWGRVKGVLEHFNEASGLYCRIINSEPRLSYTALSQMARYMDDAEKESVSEALDHLLGCVLSDPGADTVLVRNWIADYCMRKGYFHKELEITLALETSSSPVAHRLWRSAQDHFGAKRYSLAVKSGTEAYQRLQSDSVRAAVAAVMYQSYINLSENDSALGWLKLADLSREEHTVQAAALYQYTGHLQNALELIGNLEPSFTRDTLLLRQYLFKGEVERASGMAKNLSVDWRRNARDGALWEARVALFQANIADASELFDSIPFFSLWNNMKEVLNSKYWLRQLRNSENALHTWALMQYDFFLGDLDGASLLLGESSLPSEFRQMLLTQLVKRYLEAGEPQKALSAIRDGAKPDVAELLYYKARAMKKSGDLESAETVLQNILLQFPMDIYSQKARVMLLKLSI